MSGYRKKFKTAFHNENVDLRDYEKELNKIMENVEKVYALNGSYIRFLIE